MFICALILNLFASYLIASIASSFLVFYVAFFAFIILNVEILSLFNCIYDFNLLILSGLNLVFSSIIFKYKKVNFLKPKIDFKRLKNALFLDKFLIVLAFAFIILLSVSLFLAFIMPPLEPDSQTYHFFRALMFAENHNLSHFDTNDVRALIMPINSEIIYTWIYSLTHKLHGFAIFSYCSYLALIGALWSVFEHFKVSIRKRLFAIFIFSSMPCVIAQLSNLQTDITVGALLLTAFALALNKKIYFASLALSIALGVKSTAFMAIFSVFILIFYFNRDLKELKKLSLFLILNFLIFSSYNYILNLIQFHNPFSNHAAYTSHHFWGGIKGYISNLINYAFQMLDFTGFSWGYYLNDKILALKEQVFHILSIDINQGTNVPIEFVNFSTDEQVTGFGILGFLVLIPAIIKGFIIKHKNYSIFSYVFILNILILAGTLAYMTYSIRFIATFFSISAAILAFFYTKNKFIKTIITLFSVFYMAIMPFYIIRAPFFVIQKDLKKNNYNIEAFIEDCFMGHIVPVIKTTKKIKTALDAKYQNAKNIGYFKTSDSTALYLKTLKNKHFDFLAASKLNDYDLDEYDLIIVENESQDDNVFNVEDIQINYEIKDNNIYFKTDKKLQCVYYYDKNKATTDKIKAQKRECFSLYPIFQNKNFKLDNIDKEKIETLNKTLVLYYFIKSN